MEIVCTHNSSPDESHKGSSASNNNRQLSNMKNKLSLLIIFMCAPSRSPPSARSKQEKWVVCIHSTAKRHISSSSNPQFREKSLHSAPVGDGWLLFFSVFWHLKIHFFEMKNTILAASTAMNKPQRLGNNFESFFSRLSDFSHTHMAHRNAAGSGFSYIYLMRFQLLFYVSFPCDDLFVVRFTICINL
jgi:hypothetical protein